MPRERERRRSNLVPETLSPACIPEPMANCLTVGCRSSSRRADNEVVLDAWKTPWVDALPDAIVAFFVQRLASAEEKRRAREAHAAYLADATIAPTPAAATTPLLAYDPLATAAPFTLLADTP